MFSHNGHLRSVGISVLAMFFAGCATTHGTDDPLKNTRKLVTEGHVSLYQNGAFQVPNTSVRLIPAGPNALEFAKELAGLRARQSFELSIKNAAESVNVVAEGTKLTYEVAKGMSDTSNIGADRIRDYTRENSTLLVYRSSDLGKDIVAKSWDLSKRTFEAGGRAGEAIIQGSGSKGDSISDGGTRKGMDLTSGSIEAAKEIQHSSNAAGDRVSAGGTSQGLGLATGSIRAAQGLSTSSTERSGEAFSYAGDAFVKGYVAVPSKMRRRAGEMGESLADAKFVEAVVEENERRSQWSTITLEHMSNTVNNYPGNVGATFKKAGDEFSGTLRTTGLSFSMLKSLRWVLKGILWDATIEPAMNLTAASIGYIGVNFIAFPAMVVGREGFVTTKLAIEVSWDTAKMGYDLVAPTGTAALAGIYGLMDFAGSHVVAGAAAVGGTAVGIGEAGLSQVAGVAVKGGGLMAAGATATGGTVAGYTGAGLSRAAGLVVKGSGFAAGKGVQYIGVPLASAGIAVGGGTIGTAVGTVGTVSGGTLFVAGEAGAATTQVFGNIIAGTALAGGTAVSAAGGAAYGVYELSKAVVVPTGYEVGSGIVLSYGTLSHIGAHTILAVSDCSYMVLSLEGPRWVLYAVKGNTGDGVDLPVGAVVDLKKMQEFGEELYYLPVSDDEMRKVVTSTWENLPETVSGSD